MADSFTTDDTVPKAVARGRDILETFTARHYHGEPAPLTVEADAIRKDLVADLLHEAEAAGEDVDELIHRALDHYRDERDDTGDPLKISADSVEIGDVIDLDNGDRPYGEPRTVSSTRESGTQIYVEFDDNEPGASFAFDERVWKIAQ